MGDIIENPNKLTPEVVKKLEEAFSLDCSIEEACFYADISRQTYYNWINSFPNYQERFDSLRQKPVLKARQTVIKSLDEDPDMAMRYLERKRKDEFSTKQEIGIHKDKEIEKALDDAAAILKKLGEGNDETVSGERETPGTIGGPDADSGSNPATEAAQS
jgi:hypothetical protein